MPFGCLFRKPLRFVKPKFKYEIVKKIDKSSHQSVQVIDLGNARINPCKATAVSGRVSYNSIKIAFDLAANYEADAIITAPISKTAFNIAEINFPGHTEMLAKWSGTKNYVMTFLSKKLNAALLTIHKPVKMVPGLVTKERLLNTLNILYQTLRVDLNILKPKIAVLGLNPHAGENGIIGDEEEKIIKPVSKEFSIKKQNIRSIFSRCFLRCENV